MNREQGLAQIELTRLVAVVRGVETDKIAQVAEALFEGGITVMEVPLNSKEALVAIRMLQEKLGDKMYIGAGTVLDLEEGRQALEAGASFFVTPHLDEDLIRYAIQHELPIFSGALTPTEVIRAWKAGATAVKIFPSSGLGASYIRELRGPLQSVPLMAFGGVSADNISEFIAAGCFAVGVGSSIVNLDEIRKGNFAWITEQVRRLTEAVRNSK